MKKKIKDEQNNLQNISKTEQINILYPKIDIIIFDSDEKIIISE